MTPVEWAGFIMLMFGIGGTFWITKDAAPAATTVHCGAILAGLGLLLAARLAGSSR